MLFSDGSDRFRTVSGNFRKDEFVTLVQWTNLEDSKALDKRSPPNDA